MDNESNNLGDIFDKHLEFEFDKDVDATMTTMTEDPYVHNVPTLTGGRDYDVSDCNLLTIIHVLTRHIITNISLTFGFGFGFDKRTVPSLSNVVFLRNHTNENQMLLTKL